MKRWPLIGVIATITFSTLFVEVLLTRVLSVVYFGHTAFLIISLALFGYGLSGVYLSMSKLGQKKEGLRSLEFFLLFFAVSLPLVYKLVLSLRIDFLHLFHPVTNFLSLILTFLLLLIPFFFGGVSLALIFSNYANEIGRLYFIDLAGAALGSLAVVPLIPVFGPNRMLLIIFLLMILCWFLIARISVPKKGIVFASAILLFGILFKYDSAFFPILPVESSEEDKRWYSYQKTNNQIEYSRWSPINKIDVAQWGDDKKVIWINGGTMQSYIHQFNGDIRGLQPILWDAPAVPYQMAARKGSALIIGSAGGYEVLCALSHRFRSVVAVEMDPVICSLLKNEYALYSGNVFHLPQVRLLADEGRSVVQRLHNKFDVIQMVNSHNTDEILSGALSVSETYIYTVEAFKDYWNRLNDNGILYIIHWISERMLATGMQALREMGVPDPQKHFFIIQKSHQDPQGGIHPGFAHFIMKKGEFTEADHAILHDIADENEVMYSPQIQVDNFFSEIVSDPRAVDTSSVNIRPVRDRSPYFNQPNKIGQFKFSNNKITGVARLYIPPNMVFSNSIYLSIFALTLLFSLLFIYLPLKIRKTEGGSHPLILYFFLIGIAFITVEIIAIKIFQLFLGSPAVSISVIIFSLLVSSGFGSLASGKLERLFKGKGILALSLVLSAVLAVYAFSLFDILNGFLGLKFLGRIAMTLVFLFIPGFLMGIFFPFGIRVLGDRNKGAIGWAWGANAFATVLGSIVTVIISINWSFTVALLLAACCYLFSGLIVARLQRKALI